MMGKYLVIMRYLINTICIVLLLWGCDRTVDAATQPKVVRKKVVAQKEQTVKVRTNQTVRNVKTTDAATQPRVVRKKVVAQKGQTAKARTNQTVRNAKTNQAARLEKKTTAVKTDKSPAKAKNQAVPKTKTDRQTRVAKKVEVTPARDTVIKLAKPKKPAVRPKSDISETQLGYTDNSAAPSDKLIAATSNVTSKVRSVAIPATYDALGKIDPFEPLFREKAVSVKKKKKDKKRSPRTPLERIDLSQLKLVGIILASSGNRALVEESSGKGYVIKKGTYIGVNSGKVVKIKKEKVVVEEEFEDVFGKTKLRQREIKLPKPPGEF
jgi:type IV pilus assembly protein PilP